MEVSAGNARVIYGTELESKDRRKDASEDVAMDGRWCETWM